MVKRSGDRVGLRDVARAAGVTVGTASKALAIGGAPVSDGTRKRVLDAADALGYRPNRAARGLSARRPTVVGLGVAGLRNPFFVEVLEALEVACAARGLETIPEGGPSTEGTFVAHRRPGDWPVHGQIAWAFPDRAPDAAVPTVSIGHRVPEGIDAVVLDPGPAMDEIAAGLSGRIALVSPWIGRPHDWRTDAWSARLPSAEKIRIDGETVAHGRAVAGSLVGHDALILHNDALLLGVAAGLPAEAKPRLVGFDGISLLAACARPLVTVATPFTSMAEAAVELLLRRWAEPDGPPERVVLTQVVTTGGVV